jgi:hypothetical protein
MLCSAAHFSAVAICEEDVALTTYAGYAPIEQPFALACVSPVILVPFDQVGLQELLVQIG